MGLKVKSVKLHQIDFNNTSPRQGHAQAAFPHGEKQMQLRLRIDVKVIKTVQKAITGPWVYILLWLKEM